jgi:hypothetical protein
MKQLIFGLCCIALITFLACYHLGSRLTEWTDHGKNDIRNLIVMVVAFVILPTPLARIIVFLAEVFFPEKRKDHFI